MVNTPQCIMILYNCYVEDETVIGFILASETKMENAKTISVLLLVTFVSVLGNGVDSKLKAGQTLSEIDRRLKLLNKPAVKSIKVCHMLLV